MLLTLVLHSNGWTHALSGQGRSKNCRGHLCVGQFFGLSPLLIKGCTRRYLALAPSLSEDQLKGQFLYCLCHNLMRSFNRGCCFRRDSIGKCSRACTVSCSKRSGLRIGFADSTTTNNTINSFGYNEPCNDNRWNLYEVDMIQDLSDCCSDSHLWLAWKASRPDSQKRQRP